MHEWPSTVVLVALLCISCVTSTRTTSKAKLQSKLGLKTTPPKYENDDEQLLPLIPTTYPLGKYGSTPHFDDGDDMESELRNKFPVLPRNFDVEFVWNNEYRGRWTYSDTQQMSQIDYLATDENGLSVKQSYFIAWTEPKVIFSSRSESEETFAREPTADDTREEAFVLGSECQFYSLTGGFRHQFRPNSFHKLENKSIMRGNGNGYPGNDFEEEAPYIVSGEAWDYSVTCSIYPNGTLSEISIGGANEIGRWHFSNFTDLSVYQGENGQHIPSIYRLQRPEVMCSNHGDFNADEMALIQTYIPFMLVPPRAKWNPPEEKTYQKIKWKWEDSQAEDEEWDYSYWEGSGSGSYAY